MIIEGLIVTGAIAGGGYLIKKIKNHFDEIAELKKSQEEQAKEIAELKKSQEEQAKEIAELKKSQEEQTKEMAELKKRQAALERIPKENIVARNAREIADRLETNKNNNENENKLPEKLNTTTSPSNQDNVSQSNDDRLLKKILLEAEKKEEISAEKNSFKIHPNLHEHYKQLKIQLEIIIIYGCKSVASELVRAAPPSSTLSVAALGIELVSEMHEVTHEISHILGISNYANVILSVGAKMLDKVAEERFINNIKASASLGSSEHFKKAIKATARILTFQYQENLKSIKKSGIDIIIEFACKQIFGALLDGSIKPTSDLSEQFVKAVINKPHTENTFKKAILRAIGFQDTHCKLHEFYYKPGIAAKDKKDYIHAENPNTLFLHVNNTNKGKVVVQNIPRILYQG